MPHLSLKPAPLLHLSEYAQNSLQHMYVQGMLYMAHISSADGSTLSFKFLFIYIDSPRTKKSVHGVCENNCANIETPSWE